MYMYNYPYRLIRLSSPNMNQLIGLGAILLFINVITFVIPSKTATGNLILCHVCAITHPCKTFIRIYSTCIHNYSYALLQTPLGHDKS